VRQKVKTHQYWVEKSSCLRLIVLSKSAAVGEAEAGSAGEQPARNSQLETRRDDELGAAVASVAPAPQTLHRIDRFPYASENSFFGLVQLSSASEPSRTQPLHRIDRFPYASENSCFGLVQLRVQANPPPRPFIGSIDFPMPQKTHASTSFNFAASEPSAPRPFIGSIDFLNASENSCFGLVQFHLEEKHLLELSGGTIPQRRM